MSSHCIIKILRDYGWYLVAIKGSHHHFKHTTKPGKVTVPHPRKSVPKGTAHSIFKQAGIT